MVDFPHPLFFPAFPVNRVLIHSLRLCNSGLSHLAPSAGIIQECPNLLSLLQRGGSLCTGDPFLEGLFVSEAPDIIWEQQPQQQPLFLINHSVRVGESGPGFPASNTL